MGSADRGIAASEVITNEFPHKGQRQRINPRSVLILGVFVVVLHIAQESVLGTNAIGSPTANLLQIFSALLAATCCFGAVRRSSGFTRSFWLLIGLSFVVWIVADLGWMYYESYLHVPPPRNSFFHFMVDGRSLLLAIALLLDQTEESPWYFFDPVSVLDTVQLFIVFLLIYLGWYHVPSLHEA